MIIDITERKQAEEKIHYLAYHDLLTGLANRMLLQKHLISAIESADRNDEIFSVLFLDLDRFKLVNDSLGHTVGDQLLTSVAHRLKECVNSENEALVARQGGDEFIILLPKTNENGAIQVAERILLSLEKCFKIEEHHIYVSISEQLLYLQQYVNKPRVTFFVNHCQLMNSNDFIPCLTRKMYIHSIPNRRYFQNFGLTL